MKTVLWATILALALSSVLTVPIPSDKDDAFAVKEINNTSVCVISRSVYQDGELLPFKDPCEICRCRPPGIACALVRCAKRDAKPNCNVVEVKGQCCPQYQCEQQTEAASLPEVTEPTEASEVEARHDPTEEPPKPTEEPKLDQRASDAVRTSEAPPKEVEEEPKSVDLERSTAAPEGEVRQERLTLAATEDAKDAEVPPSEAPLEPKEGEEPTEAPEREPKLESGATSEVPTAQPDKSERKEDASQQPEESSEGPKEEQGRSDELAATTVAQDDLRERATKSIEGEPEVTESGVTPRSDVQAPVSSEGNSGEQQADAASQVPDGSVESTEAPKAAENRKRRETPVLEETESAEEKDDDGEQTTAAPEIQDQPEVSEPPAEKESAEPRSEDEASEPPVTQATSE